MLPVDLLPGARRDFDEAFDWYAHRSADVAVQFANAIDAALAELAAEPHRFRLIDGKHHQARVNRFPFRIVFRVVKDRVLVVAIAHAKRRPAYWNDRPE